MRFTAEHERWLGETRKMSWHQTAAAAAAAAVINQVTIVYHIWSDLGVSRFFLFWLATVLLSFLNVFKVLNKEAGLPSQVPTPHRIPNELCFSSVTHITALKGLFLDI